MRDGWTSDRIRKTGGMEGPGSGAVRNRGRGASCSWRKRWRGQRARSLRWAAMRTGRRRTGRAGCRRRVWAGTPSRRLRKSGTGAGWAGTGTRLRLTGRGGGWQRAGHAKRSGMQGACHGALLKRGRAGKRGGLLGGMDPRTRRRWTAAVFWARTSRRRRRTGQQPGADPRPRPVDRRLRWHAGVWGGASGRERSRAFRPWRAQRRCPSRRRWQSWTCAAGGRSYSSTGLGRSRCCVRLIRKKMATRAARGVRTWM